MEKKYVKRGALIGFIISLCVWIFFLGYEWLSHVNTIASVLSGFCYGVLYRISIFGWYSLLGPWPEVFGYIFPSISLTLYGAIIGGLYGKIKNKVI